MHAEYSQQQTRLAPRTISPILCSFHLQLVLVVHCFHPGFGPGPHKSCGAKAPAAPARISDRLRFAPDNFSPGGKSSRVAGYHPTSCDRRSNSALHHPGNSFPAGTIGSRKSVLSYCLFRQARIELATLSAFAKTLYRSNAHLHHTGNSCGGNRRRGCFAIALPIELQRLASPAGFEPATAGAM